MYNISSKRNCFLTKTHLTDYLQEHAASKKDKAAIVFEGESLSWAELWQEVEAVGNYLAGTLGTDEQKVVDILLTNSSEFVITYLAILHAGHIALPLDPAYKKLELDAIIDQIPPELIITDARYSGQIGRHKAIKLMVDDLLAKRGAQNKLLRLPAPEQIASLTFTSGTSGRPKAVPNTHTNHLWNIKVCSEVWDWTANDTLLITLPLSHMHGLVMGLSGALYHGNTLYLRQQSFDTKGVLEDLSSGKISLFTHAPIAYMKMLAQPGDYDLSKVRLFISGSAPLPPRLWQDFKDRWGIEILETYGSSETGRIAANILSKRMSGSPGKVLPGVDLKLSSTNEVQIKSPGVFPGYYHNKSATDESKSKDGYWRTGDIGELKDDYLYLKGRVQEKIRRFGYSISPRDVEWALYKNPKIKEAQVIGIQSQSGANDELIYFVVGDIDGAAIQDYCKVNLPFSWRPDKVVVLGSLPRTANGKPQIAILKELAGVS